MNKEELKAMRELCKKTRCDQCEYHTTVVGYKHQELSNRKCFTAPCYWLDNDIERMAKQDVLEK